MSKAGGEVRRQTLKRPAPKSQTRLYDECNRFIIGNIVHDEGESVSPLSDRTCPSGCSLSPGWAHRVKGIPGRSATLYHKCTSRAQHGHWLNRHQKEYDP